MSDLEFRWQPVSGERKRRRYLALQHWSESTGGEFTLVERAEDLNRLAMRLQREPNTNYIIIARLERSTQTQLINPDFDVQVPVPGARIEWTVQVERAVPIP